MRLLRTAIATFCGVGFIPLAPGTVASFAVVLLHRWVLHRWSLPLVLSVLAVLIFVGVRASEGTAAAFGKKDPRVIVIDEVCGQMTALLLAPPDWIPSLAGFALFRFFDILKPPPIRRLERLPGGWGIVVDDLAAGLLSFLLLRAYFSLT